MTTQLTIGIPAYDDWKKLEALLISLRELQTKIIYEVIVGDDCHPDDLATKVHENFPEVTVFRNAINSGPAFTRNRIFEQAKGEYVAFFDADCVVPKNWVEQVKPHLAPNRILSCRVFRPDNSIEWTARRSTWMGVSLRCEDDQASVASSNNMVTPLALALSIGGFNESLRIYFEDSLFSIQANRSGAELQYIPDATVVHHHHSLLNPGRLHLQARNTLWSMFHVYRGQPHMQLACTLALLTNYSVKTVIHLLKLEPKFSSAYLQGMVAGVGWIFSKKWRQNWIDKK